jgi:hypothetical protein
VIGDAPELGPGAERSDRRFFAGGKYPARGQLDLALTVTECARV